MVRSKAGEYDTLSLRRWTLGSDRPQFQSHRPHSPSGGLILSLAVQFWPSHWNWSPVSSSPKKIGNFMSIYWDYCENLNEIIYVTWLTLWPRKHENSECPTNGNYCHYFYYHYHHLIPCEPSIHCYRGLSCVSSSWNDWMRSVPAGWGFRATQDDSITTTTSRERHSRFSMPCTSHPAGSRKPMARCWTSAVWLRLGAGGSRSPATTNWQSSWLVILWTRS